MSEMSTMVESKWLNAKKATVNFQNQRIFIFSLPIVFLPVFFFYFYGFDFFNNISGFKSFSFIFLVLIWILAIFNLISVVRTRNTAAERYQALTELLNRLNLTPEECNEVDEALGDFSAEKDLIFLGEDYLKLSTGFIYIRKGKDIMKFEIIRTEDVRNIRYDGSNNEYIAVFMDDMMQELGRLCIVKEALPNVDAIVNKINENYGNFKLKLNTK